MAWGSSNTILDHDTVDTTPSVSSEVTLNPGERAHVQIMCARGGTTNDLGILVYSQVDGTNYDTIALVAFIIETATAATQYASFIVADVYAFKVSVYSTGETDNHDVHVYCRKDGVSL